MQRLLDQNDPEHISEYPLKKRMRYGSESILSFLSSRQENRKQFTCLRNLGSTCYINCIIQVIRYSPGFLISIQRLIKQIVYLKSLNTELEKEINNNNDSIFVQQLNELFIEMSDKEKLDRRPVYSPRKFVDIVLRALGIWSNNTQQDAHEFLQYTIHFINECDFYLKKLHEQYQAEKLSKTCEDEYKLQQKQQQISDNSLFIPVDSSKSRLKISYLTPTKGGAATIKTSTTFLSNSKFNYNNFEVDKKNNHFMTNSIVSKRKSKSISISQESIKSDIIACSIDEIETLECNNTTKSTRSKTSRVSEALTIPVVGLLCKFPSLTGYLCEMDKLFKGLSVTLTQCLTCENLKKSQEVFYDRTLPVNTINNESMDLEWILKCLNNESLLDEDSKYMCDICRSKQEAKIYTQYTEMPNILVFHLLPFGIVSSSNEGNINTQKLTNNRSKLVSCFDCICEECLKNRSKNILKRIKHVFKLYAVVMHSGINLHNGHYTTYINYQAYMNNQNQENEDFSTANEDSLQWLHFDDAHLKLLSNSEFNSKIIDNNFDSPYILFYVKEDSI